MIEYDTVDSSFFRANKKYIESIQQDLDALNIVCFGYCDGFGYDVEAEFERGGLKFKLKFIKHQTTQNGISKPIDANEYTGTCIYVTGIARNYKLVASKSLLQRCFCSKRIKIKMPKPYFLRFSNPVNDEIIDDLAKSLIKNEISKILIKNEKCKVVIHKSVNAPIELIDDIEYIIKRL